VLMRVGVDAGMGVGLIFVVDSTSCMSLFFLLFNLCDREACNLKDGLLKSEASRPYTISGVCDSFKALGVVFSWI
jgi:hypothetical protein